MTLAADDFAYIAERQKELGCTGDAPGGPDKPGPEMTAAEVIERRDAFLAIIDRQSVDPPLIDNFDWSKIAGDYFSFVGTKQETAP